jgi:hypothetical protein
MNVSSAAHSQASQYELRYSSLFNEGRGYAFPCDASGRVDLDELSTRARNNYLYARACIGREFARPSVQVRSGNETALM